MTISQNSKEALIDALLNTKRKGHRLEISLRFRGKIAEADAVNAKTRKLTRQVDDLLAHVMDDWSGSAGPVIRKMGKTNTKLQAAIRDIKKKINIAENVIKATGYVDDLIEMGAKLIV